MRAVECRVEVVLEGLDRDIAAAVEPDNRSSPPGVEVECRGGEDLYCIIEVDCSSPREVLRLRNTVDDLLQAVIAAARALESVKG